MFCFTFRNYFLHYIIKIIFIVFNIYSVDEGDLQRNEVPVPDDLYISTQDSQKSAGYRSARRTSTLEPLMSEIEAKTQ